MGFPGVISNPFKWSYFTLPITGDGTHFEWLMFFLFVSVKVLRPEDTAEIHFEFVTVVWLFSSESMGKPLMTRFPR